MTNKTTKLIILLLLCSSIFFSCRKEFTEKSQKCSETISYSDISMVTGPGSEDNMEFAPQTPNPYTLPNMQAALDSLALRNELQCDITKFEIRATHKYIKFKPEDSIQYGLLIQDTSLILFDYPMDRRITKGGTYYRESNIPEGQPNYQWTCVTIDKILPSGIPYDVISDLYIPEEDPNLVQYYNTEFDHCITLLIDEALKRTGNYDTSNYYGGMTSGGDLVSLKLPTKWTPAGNIKMSDDFTNSDISMRGVKVRAHRWFETREKLTDNNGNFNVGHQFRYPVDYSIKWERNDFEIRHKKIGQAYFNGPHQRGDWNLQINSGYSRLYAIIHRAAHRYYYEARENLKAPPLKSQMVGRITIGAFDWNEHENLPNGDCRMGVRLAFDEIRIFRSSRDCRAIFATTVHELAHASHWNLGYHSEFNNTDTIVRESWARGVQWALTRLEYTTYLGGATILPYYTQVVVDMIDNQTIENNPGTNGWDFVDGDSVSGYTIKEIEDALKGKKTWNDWRDNIKSKYSNATENKLDALFDHWN